MDDARGVGLGQPIGDLDGVPESVVELDPLAADQLVERLPLNELHDDEIPALIGGDVVDDDDVGVAQGRGGLGLLGEAAPALGVGHLVRRQDLDSHGPVEVGVFGPVNGAHAALADPLDDPVMQERLADQSGMVHASPSLFLPYMSAAAQKSIRASGRPRYRASGEGEISSPESPLGVIVPLRSPLQNDRVPGRLPRPGEPP